MHDELLISADEIIIYIFLFLFLKGKYAVKMNIDKVLPMKIANFTLDLCFVYWINIKNAPL